MGLAPAGLVVVIVGATGAVGRDLVAALEKPPFRVRELRLVASKASREAELPFAGGTLPVVALGGRGGDGVFDGSDLVFFAAPPDLVRLVAPRVAARGTAVIDVGGALLDTSPVYVPWVARGGWEAFDRGRIASTPDAASVALATVLSPLRPLGLVGARATVLLSAGLLGTGAVEELSQQVVALLNSQTPPRKHFPTGLAFDLVAPAEAPEPDGWTAAERRCGRVVGALCGLEPERVVVSQVRAPLFAGLALEVQALFDDNPGLPEVRAALEGAEHLRFGDPVPGPRRLPGRPRLHAGRLRADPAGEGVHLWVTADNLRFAATGCALALAAELVREGRIGAAEG